MPGTGSRVVNGYAAIVGVALVSVARRVDLPAFGGPRKTTWPASCLGILNEPGAAFFGAAAAASTSSVSSLIFVLRAAWTFSLALCLGRITHISRRAESFSCG